MTDHSIHIFWTSNNSPDILVLYDHGSHADIPTDDRTTNIKIFSFYNVLPTVHKYLFPGTATGAVSHFEFFFHLNIFTIRMISDRHRSHPRFLDKFPLTPLVTLPPSASCREDIIFNRTVCVCHITFSVTKWIYVYFHISNNLSSNMFSKGIKYSKKNDSPIVCSRPINISDITMYG